MARGEIRTVRAARGVRELGARLADPPRERLLANGVAALSGSELISVVLAKGSPSGSASEIAQRLLGIHDTLADLARADPLELVGIPGVGPARAAQLAAAFELGRRSIQNGHTQGQWTIRSPRDVSERLILEMGHLEREELRVLVLNAKNVVLRCVTVYQGNVSGALVRVGELFRDAVRVNAAGLILVHNHPSGDPEPSPDDLTLTGETIAAGRLLDIAVLDHVIVAASVFVSLRDRGVQFDRR
jgi:DNA repair protein RadC